MIHLPDHLTRSRVVDLRATTKDASLVELVDTFADADEVADRKELLQAVVDRERIVSTGIGFGVAVPHAKIASVSDFVVAYGRSRDGIDFESSIDDRPVHHVVLIAGPPDRQQRYLQFLATVTLKLKSPELRLALEFADDAGQLFDALVGDG